MNKETPSAAPQATRLENVSKVYETSVARITALEQLSLEIRAGEAVALMGPSGCGKTTMLNLIGGMDRPSGGNIWVDGENVAAMTERQLEAYRLRKIGFVFQFFNLLPTLTAEENVALPLLLDGRSQAEANARAGVLLAKVGLEQRGKHRPEELSGGEVQRIAIARALAFNPPILLADEPTGNLDSKTGEAILSLLRRINDEEGCTVVMVTHSDEAARYGDRTIFLRDGRVEEKDKG